MSSPDPLSPYLGLGAVPSLLSDASAGLARAHRRPAALRRAGIIVGESVLRGAKLSSLIDDHPVETYVSPYAVLAPDAAEQTARTFRRAPLQVLARIDVATGGNGTPAGSEASARLQALSRLITAPEVDGLLLAQVVHFEIAARELFGEHSGVVGRVASRCAALATGADPLGIAVPETYLHRHKREYAEAVTAWGSGDVTSGLEFGLRAWIAGADEADGIARAA